MAVIPEKKSKKNVGSASRLPVKHSINMMYEEHRTENTLATVILLLIIVGAAYLFVQFAVIRMIEAGNRAEALYNQMAGNLEAIKLANSDYAEVRKDYSHYGNVYLDEEELALQDRVTMLNIIDERIHAAGGIQQERIEDNAAVISMEIPDASKLPDIIRSLEGSNFIEHVVATTAGTVDRRLDTVIGADGKPVTVQYVIARLTVYFRSEAERQKAIEEGVIEDNDADLNAAASATGKRAYVPEILSVSEKEDLTLAGQQNYIRKEMPAESSAEKDTAAASANAGGKQSAGSSSGLGKTNSSGSSAAAKQNSSGSGAAGKQSSAGNSSAKQAEASKAENDARIKAAELAQAAAAQQANQEAMLRAQAAAAQGNANTSQMTMPTAAAPMQTAAASIDQTAVSPFGDGAALSIRGGGPAG